MQSRSRTSTAHLRPAAALSVVSLALLLTGSAHHAAAQPTAPAPLTATVQQDYVLPDPAPLFMPTAVTIAPDGSVFVVDGVNDRIVQFSADGAPTGQIQQIGDVRLSRPMSAKAAPDNRLWITDTGYQRVVIVSADGAHAELLTWPAEQLDHAPDFTDLALTAGGSVLWLVDNDHHTLLRCDLTQRRTTVIGREGESLAEFHYPFMLATTPADEVIVTDVINGRAQVLTPDGVPTGTIGSYGVEPGQFYRPKGVAVDADGNTWVSDSTLGVVQAFRPTGRLIDVLRDNQGAPLRFASPMGLAFDAAGDLYVVELLANRVRRLHLHRDPQALPPDGAAGSPGAARQPQARSCTACHFEWLRPLADGRGTALASVPPNPAEQPFVSRSTVCLGCHDGGVGDSRRTVWVEHGHRTEIPPPDDMHVPDRFPLVYGQLACRTCHSAHGSGAPSGDMATAIFLRVEHAADELCLGCHTAKSGGPQHGDHPLGPMPDPVPATLVSAGARPGPDPRVLSCQTCHTAHGALHDPLLVMPANRNGLCLACHDWVRPGATTAAESATHPISPNLTAAQIATVRSNGGRVSSDDQLICFSCHSVHDARSDHYLLRRELTDSGTCTGCHPDQTVVLNSVHDLRTSFPHETNRVGQTAQTGGPCSSCHMFHRVAREPEPTALDPQGGQCLTCHNTGRVAARKVLGPENHPGAPCTACHNPHDNRFGNFAAQQPADRCTACHADKRPLVGGPHDVARDKTDWPEIAQQSGDRCLACHRPHAPAGGTLFRLTADGVAGTDAACVACHARSAPGTTDVRTLVHPSGPTTLAAGLLPLDVVDGKPAVACSTCHDPHADPSAARPLLRQVAGGTIEDLCLECHAERRNIGMIGHAPRYLSAAGFEPDGCRPCHLIHADPRTTETAALWPESLTAAARAANASRANEHCVACHRDGGPVTPPAIAVHPDVPMFNPVSPDAPGFLPLYNEAGDVDPKGTIACRTCHLTHGRTDPLPMPLGLADTASREARARIWHLRSFGDNNVCTTCHGFDALRRLMYFHDAERRTGPIEGNTAPPP